MRTGMRKHWRWKILCLVCVSCLTVIGICSINDKIDDTLNAETVELDDSPLGEKIVDVQVSSSGQAYMALSESGHVYAWGYPGAGGMLGTGEGSAYTTVPKKVLAPDGSEEKYLSNIKKLYLGGGSNGPSAIAIDKANQLYAWGKGTYYNLGLPAAEYKKPVKVNLNFDEPIKEVHAAYLDYDTLFLMESGKVYGIGRNSVGVLGLGHKNVVSTPTQITQDYDNNPFPIVKKLVRNKRRKCILMK